MHDDRDNNFRLLVARPHLPRTDALIPYLRQIDETRWYTNGGPLVRRLEARLADAVGIADSSVAHVTSVASATTGLTIALQAALGGRRGTCLVQSWTFAATPCAILAAGLTPHFVDVEPDTWLADRRQVADLAGHAQADIAALLLVQRAGQAVDLDPWRELAAAHDLALVVDAADCFDCVRPGPEAQVVSLHACKALGAGEGGFIVSTDPALIDRARQLSNFGFSGHRVSDAAGINAKLSEYAAAVGLAALDAWPQTRACWLERAAAYRGVLAGHGLDLLAPAEAACSTALVDLGGPFAPAVAAELLADRIEARRWWGDGCHRQPAFTRWPAAATPVTDALAAQILGLPFHVDLDDEAMTLVVDLLARNLSDARPHGAAGPSIGSVRG
jgi:dTDP-4-amino-4,6-dideoxygalactose transaminase